MAGYGEKGLTELSREAYAMSKEKGFHDKEKSFGDDIALMHSELSEALEDHRNGYSPNNVWYESPDQIRHRKPTFDGALLKPCGIPSEMADVIIRVLDFCGKHGIDIGKVVEEKMAFNATRPHLHGGKKL